MSAGAVQGPGYGSTTTYVGEDDAVSPDLLFPEWVISVTDSGNFTINAPAGTDGDLLSITVSNDSGGVMGTITWDTDFVLATAWVKPADGEDATRAFQFSGAKWYETSLLDDAVEPTDEDVFTDGITRPRLAVATYDFAEHGGAIGPIDLGVDIPADSVITNAWYEVHTTCTTAGADAGTMALSAEGADDLVAAVAVSNGGNPYDAGFHGCIPDGTAAKFIKTTAARALTATIAVQAFTAGKFTLYVEYVRGQTA